MDGGGEYQSDNPNCSKGRYLFLLTLSISDNVTFEGSMVLVFGIECARGRF